VRVQRRFFEILAIVLTAVPLSDARAAVTIEKVEYRGWRNNLKIANGDAELIVTLDVGPRVISYRLVDGKNVFKNYDEMMGKSGEPSWMIRGGHRVWAAPEDPARTYALDNGPVAYKELRPGQVRFTPAPETSFGLQKELDITLAPTGSQVVVAHAITNIGKAETQLAVWSLSVMAPGGMEIIPLPPKRRHPGDAKNARSADDFAPDLFLSIWPFFDFKDSRWSFGSNYITLTQDATKGATKLGVAHKTGRVGYLNDGMLFVKQFGFTEGRHYPDHGVNFETFTNEDMLEMESLGPLSTLAPGQSVGHVERWELFGGLGAAKTEAEIDQKVGPKLK
jgi:hypothetical protein